MRGNLSGQIDRPIGNSYRFSAWPRPYPHDLARWVHERTGAMPARGQHLAPSVGQAATDLVSSIALALTFPRRRAQHLADADEAIVRLRTALRLARDLALISSRGLRYATGRLQAIGRMLGGWRKRVDKSSLAAPAASENTGDGPPPARNA